VLIAVTKGLDGTGNASGYGILVREEGRKGKKYGGSWIASSVSKLL